MTRILALLIAFTALASVHVHAATLREVIRTCGDDSKKLCEGVGYGKPMQDCLSANKPKLTPQCKALVTRLDKGEKVTLF